MPHLTVAFMSLLSDVASDHISVMTASFHIGLGVNVGKVLNKSCGSFHKGLYGEDRFLRLSLTLTIP